MLLWAADYMSELGYGNTTGHESPNAFSGAKTGGKKTVSLDFFWGWILTVEMGKEQRLRC